MSACECAACGIVTTGLGPFDKHQDVDYRRRPAVVCLDPATVGMSLNAYGRWGFPGDAAPRGPGQPETAGDAPVHTPVTPQDSGAAESSTAP